MSHPSPVVAVPLGVLVACAAQFLVGADGLAVAVALPTIQRDLRVVPLDAQWALTAYALAFGGSLLLGGRLGDLYGRRRLLSYGMGAFAAASILAAAAPGLPLLVVARALQGLGAAAAVPSSLALIGSVVPPGPARARALGMLGAMTSLGIATGLLIGGALTDVLGWRMALGAPAPFALAAALAAPRVLPEVRAAGSSRRPDALGAALVTSALLAILVGLTDVERDGPTSGRAIVPVVTGTLLLAAFAARERRVRAPLLRLELLALRSLRVATLGVGINAVAFTAVAYVGTQYLQRALGYGPLEAGVRLLPLNAVATVVVVAAGRRGAGRSPRLLLGASFATTAAALAWLARAPVPASYVRDVLGPLVVLGGSLAVAFVVLTQEAVAEVGPDEKGIASGLFETANHLFGGAVGVALYATLIGAAGPTGSAAGSYGRAFLGGSLLALVGVVVARGARDRAAAEAGAGGGGEGRRAEA